MGMQVPAEGVIALELELQEVLCSQVLVLGTEYPSSARAVHSPERCTISEAPAISNIICKQKDAEDTNWVSVTQLCCTPHQARVSLQLNLLIGVWKTKKVRFLSSWL